MLGDIITNISTCRDNIKLFEINTFADRHRHTINVWPWPHRNDKKLIVHFPLFMHLKYHFHGHEAVKHKFFDLHELAMILTVYFAWNLLKRKSPMHNRMIWGDELICTFQWVTEFAVSNLRNGYSLPFWHCNKRTYMRFSIPIQLLICIYKLSVCKFIVLCSLLYTVKCISYSSSIYAYCVLHSSIFCVPFTH